MIRAAWKTFNGFEDMHTELVEKASSCLCLVQAGRCFRPPGWDSDAFCSNLYYACHFEGLRYAIKCKQNLVRVCQDWRAGRVKSLQSSIYKVLYKTVDGAQVWTDLINEKLGVLVGGVHHDRVMLRCNLLEFINGLHKCPSSSRT